MSEEIFPKKLCHCGDRIPLSSPLGEYSKEIINRDVCQDLPVKYEHEGNLYCILHYPDKDKSDDFEKVIKERLSKQEYKFQAVWFPRRTNYFHEYRFENNEVNFTFAHFFANADFWHAVFSEKTFFEFATFNREALFSFATFTVANFHQVYFLGEAIFYNTRFTELAHFSSSRFSFGASFTFTQIKHAFFSEVVFLNDNPDEDRLKFDGAKLFDITDFSQAKFPSKTSFSNSIFDGDVLFWGANFKEVYFNEAKFLCEVFFSFSSFENNVLFSETIFEKTVDFTNCTFLDSIKFLSEKGNHLFLPNSTLSFEHSFAEKPERISFHTINLRPSYFVNVDLRKFIFTNIFWENADGSRKTVISEIDSLKEQETVNPHRLLTITCRQLAQNAEENNRLEEASSFRRMALETERLERKEKRKIWLAGFSHTFKKEINLSNFFSYSGTAIKNSWSLTKTFPSDVLHFLYRIFSGYGERWFRAFCWLIAIWLFWAFLYATPICDFIEKEKYSFSYWIGYSLNVITLQRPEPKPANAFTMIILGLEVLFAPLQAALLILAVRRKFMR